MLIPIIVGNEGVLLEVGLSSAPGHASNKLEDFLADCDAVNALYDAFTAFFILTGEMPTREPYLAPGSAELLSVSNTRIVGDSLGLGVLLLLLNTGGQEFDVGGISAATGALDVRCDKIMCRPVDQLTAKLDAAVRQGVSTVFCPRQFDAPSHSYRGLLVRQVSQIKNRAGPLAQMEVV